ncbi:hypothetical protein PS676_03759 [Pseudomonas fluorescens]|nr:hypothetical protein PS676_03759 [Pseudomonas fluorescens]
MNVRLTQGPSGFRINRFGKDFLAQTLLESAFRAISRMLADCIDPHAFADQIPHHMEQHAVFIPLFKQQKSLLDLPPLGLKGYTRLLQTHAKGQKDSVRVMLERFGNALSTGYQFEQQADAVLRSLKVIADEVPEGIRLQSFLYVIPLVSDLRLQIAGLSLVATGAF